VRRVFRLLDFALDWWERAQWVGAPGGAMLITYASLVWAWLAEQPPVCIALIILNAFAVSFFLLTYVPQQLRRLYPRPFAVSIPSVLTEGGNRQYSVKVYIRVMNRSRTDSLSLEFALCLRRADGQERWSHQPEVSGMTTQVRPQREVAGIIAFDMMPFADFIPTDKNTVYVYDGTIRTSATAAKKDNPGGIFLQVTDRWSGRDKCFRIPGSYPPGYFAPPILISSGIS